MAGPRYPSHHIHRGVLGRQPFPSCWISLQGECSWKTIQADCPYKTVSRGGGSDSGLTTGLSHSSCHPPPGVSTDAMSCNLVSRQMSFIPVSRLPLTDCLPQAEDAGLTFSFINWAGWTRWPRGFSHVPQSTVHLHWGLLFPHLDSQAWNNLFTAFLSLCLQNCSPLRRIGLGRGWGLGGGRVGGLWLLTDESP